MRRKTLSMRVSAIIMAAVVGMSSMTMHVQAAGTQERVVEGTNTIMVTLPDSIKLSGGGMGGGLEGFATVSARYTDASEAVDTVRVTVDTSVEFTNTGDSSQKVTGSVTFGSSGVADWSVYNLRYNQSRYIMVESPVPEKTGVYEGSIDYTIELRHDGDQFYDDEYYVSENYFHYTQSSGNTIQILTLTILGMEWMENTHTLILPSQAQLNSPYYCTVTSVGRNAFSSNPAITNVHIPTTLECIYANAFWGCPNIQTVYYKGTREEFLQSQLYKNWCAGNEPLENAHWVFTDCESDFPAKRSYSLIKEDEVDLSDYEEMVLESETNLYAGRDTDSEVLENLKADSIVYIISAEREENGVWYEVYTPDKVKGFIFIEDEKEEKSENDVDLSSYEELVLEAETVLYAERGTDAEVLKTLENGSVVYIIVTEQGENGIWYEIYTADQERGYIFIESSVENDTEEETETESETGEGTESEEDTDEESSETEESTSDGESSETGDSTDEESTETDESTSDGESSETEESTNEESSGVETPNTDESPNGENSEESSGVSDNVSEDAGTDESATVEESSVTETSEEVVIEEGGEDIPKETESDIPEVKIEVEVRDGDDD